MKLFNWSQDAVFLISDLVDENNLFHLLCLILTSLFVLDWGPGGLHWQYVDKNLGGEASPKLETDEHCLRDKNEPILDVLPILSRSPRSCWKSRLPFSRRVDTSTESHFKWLWSKLVAPTNPVNKWKEQINKPSTINLFSFLHKPHPKTITTG